jgi:hypothetical protein
VQAVRCECESRIGVPRECGEKVVQRAAFAGAAAAWAAAHSAARVREFDDDALPSVAERHESGAARLQNVHESTRSERCSVGSGVRWYVGELLPLGEFVLRIYCDRAG